VLRHDAQVIEDEQADPMKTTKNDGSVQNRRVISSASPMTAAPMAAGGTYHPNARSE
jgi:hypothetical protein